MGYYNMVSDLKIDCQPYKSLEALKLDNLNILKNLNFLLFILKGLKFAKQYKISLDWLRL